MKKKTIPILTTIIVILFIILAFALGLTAHSKQSKRASVKTEYVTSSSSASSQNSSASTANTSSTDPNDLNAANLTPKQVAALVAYHGSTLGNNNWQAWDTYEDALNNGAPLNSTDNFCIQCGTPAKELTDQDETQTTKTTQEEQLQRQINKLQTQLKRQKQNNSVNVFARLAFTRSHMMQVLNFMKDNALTLFIIAVLMIIPWPTNFVRIMIFLIYLVGIYIYPLLSNQKRFMWNEALENWLHDKDNLKRLKSNTQNAMAHVKKKIRRKPTTFADCSGSF